MLERALKLIVVVTLAVFLAEVVVGELTRLLRSAVAIGWSALGSAGGLLGAAVLLVLVIGLVVRLVRWGRAASSGRIRGRGQGQAEWGSRAFADDVPAERGKSRKLPRPRRRT